MDTRFRTFIKEKFNLTPEQIAEMTEPELDDLYEKAMALEEILAVENQDKTNEEVTLAADFVDYLHGPYE